MKYGNLYYLFIYNYILDLSANLTQLLVSFPSYTLSPSPSFSLDICPTS